VFGWSADRDIESPRRSRLPRLAALLTRSAHCGACIAGVRRERLALSVRQVAGSHSDCYRWPISVTKN